jgi:hypothetical protein
MIADRGSATVDDLYPDLADRYTRAQVQHAIENARGNGLIHCKGPVRKQGASRGSLPAVHYPGPKPDPNEPPAAPRVICRPPNSAWELASERVTPVWPPLYRGRQMAPLGPWNEDAA